MGSFKLKNLVLFKSRDLDLIDEPSKSKSKVLVVLVLSKSRNSDPIDTKYVCLLNYKSS